MIGNWRGIFRLWCCAALIGLSGQAQAAFHLWQITEVYSNANGTVQFIELTTSSPFETLIGGHSISSSQGATTNVYTFPTGLSGSTQNKRLLLGTSGFEALNIVAPDYVIPNGFLFINNGTLNFANVDFFSYTSLPTDGVLSLNRDMTTGINSPTNFAGQFGSISLPAANPPGAPTNVIASAAGISQLNVSYTPPANNGGANITSYTALCGTLSASGLANPLLVSGLPKGVPVSCTVTATNSAGPGPASSPSAAVAPLGVPDAPTIGNAVAGDGQVTISFTAPSNTGGSPITQFTATCGGLTASGANSPLTVSGLSNGISVSCTVTATNAQGVSPASGASNSVTPVSAATAPGAPVIGLAVAGNAQVTVNFSPPGNDGGAAISIYTATCGPVSAGGNGSPITVFGLTNGVAVSCTVVATNNVGTSAPSAPSNSVTPLGLPGAPTIGLAVAGNTQVTVNFTAPGNNGGSIITSYTATCGTQNNSAANSPIIVSGLVNGIAVTCRLIATTAVGNSAPSAASNSVTPATLPGAPVIGAGVPGNASASVAFTVPASNGGLPILGYTAACTNAATTLSATGTTSPLYVFGLTNGLPYTCNVKASNALGTGPASGDVLIAPAGSAITSGVVSRKSHNGVPRDLPIAFDLPPGAPPTIEPRLIGNGHVIIFQFSVGTITNPGTLTVTPNIGNATFNPVGNDVVVTFTGIPDNQRITVTLGNVQDTGENASTTIGFLAGDVSGSGGVNAGDISAVKARVGQTVGANNFKFDINLTGDIGPADVSVVKSRAGRTLL